MAEALPPIAVIRTKAELALRRERSTSDYEGALRNILVQSERTADLVENLLTLARADTGKSDLPLAPVDLGKAIAEAAEIGRKLAATKGLEFAESAKDGILMVRGDAQALRRLALILIDNAIKYTPSPGSVRIRRWSGGGTGEFEVCDSGMGISSQDLPHIFERFYRADPAYASDTGGAGLGLAMAHWIVQQHRGSIDVESAVGRGSKFRVSIPLARSGAAAD